MTENERIELEAERAGREDYLREAYTSEASMLAAIDRDHDESLYEAWLASLTPAERAEHDAKLALQRAEHAAAVARMLAPSDDVPF